MLKKLIIMSIVLFITAFNAHAADYKLGKSRGIWSAF
jgi:hypothetical protein